MPNLQETDINRILRLSLAQAQERGVLSVKDFGAVGDGVTDDLTNIQAAEDYCASLGYPVELYFHGDHLVSDTVDKKAKVHWRGTGTIRRTLADSGDAYPTVLAFEVDDWSIEGLTIKAAPIGTVDNLNASSFASDNAALIVAGCDNWRVEKCSFRSFTNGLRVLKARNYQILYNDFDGENPDVDEADLWSDTIDAAMNPLSVASGDITSYPGYAVGGYGHSGGIESIDYLIHGNSCRTAGLDAGIAIGLQTYDPNPGTISSNFVQGKNHGIQFYNGSNTDPGDATTSAFRALVENNRIQYCYQNGIYVRGRSGLLIKNNYLWRNNRKGPFNSSTGGGIVARVDPRLTYTVSSGVDHSDVTQVVGNKIIDTGNPTSGTDAGVVTRQLNIIVEGNLILNSDAFDKVGSAIAGSAPYSKPVVLGNKISNFASAISNTYIDWDDVLVPLEIKDNSIDTVTNGIVITPYGPAIIERNAILADGTAINIRRAPKSVVRSNALTADVGLLIRAFCGLSAYQEAVATGDADESRGASVIVADNIFDCVTSDVSTDETNPSDAVTYGRVIGVKGNVSAQGSFIDKKINGDSDGQPSSSNCNGKTFEIGDEMYDSSPSAGGYERYVATVAGTAGQIDAADIECTTDGTTAVVGVAQNGGGTNWKNIYVGSYVTITGVGNGPFKVTAMDYVAEEITLDAIPDTQVTDADIEFAQPTMKGAGAIQA